MEKLNKDETIETIRAEFDDLGYFLTALEPVIVYIAILYIIDRAYKYIAPVKKFINDSPVTANQIELTINIGFTLILLFSFYKCIYYFVVDFKILNDGVYIRRNLKNKNYNILPNNELDKYLSYRFLFFKLRHTINFRRITNNNVKFNVSLKIPEETTCNELIQIIKKPYNLFE